MAFSRRPPSLPVNAGFVPRFRATVGGVDWPRLVLLCALAAALGWAGAGLWRGLTGGAAHLLAAQVRAVGWVFLLVVAALFALVGSALVRGAFDLLRP